VSGEYAVQAERAAAFVAAATAAAERYEALTASDEARRVDTDAQRWLGAALGRAAAAEALLEETAAAPPLEAEDELRLALMAREAMRLAWTAILELARVEPAAFEQTARELVGGLAEPREEAMLRDLARARLGIG